MKCEVVGITLDATAVATRDPRDREMDGSQGRWTLSIGVQVSTITGPHSGQSITVPTDVMLRFVHLLAEVTTYPKEG